jgi:hypothetical protein
MPLPAWAVMAGAQAIGGIVKSQNAYSQGQRNIDLAGITPSEREYMAKQKAIAKGGDPLINSQGQRAIQTVRQQGQFNQQRATGQAIGQGLENSIVAAELRRKVDKDTLRSVADQSRRMAEANILAKRQAEDRQLQMQMGIDARTRQAQMGAPSRGERDLGMLGSIAQAGLGAYGGHLQTQQQSAAALKQFGEKAQITTDNYIARAKAASGAAFLDRLHNPSGGGGLWDE